MVWLKIEQMVQFLMKNSQFWSPQKLLEMSAGLLKKIPLVYADLQRLFGSLVGL